MHGALLPGWTFLTGDAFDIDTLRFALFRHNHIKFDLTRTATPGSCASSTMRSIVGADAAAGTRHGPATSWADPPKSYEQRMQDNRALQDEIGREVAKYGYRKVI